MYKFLILFLILPLFGMAQHDKNEQLYLTADNQISKQKTAIKCVLENDLSGGYVECYNGIGADNKVVKQLNQSVHVNESLKPKLFAAYVKSMGYEQYLVGDFKNGKPYNGFFRAPKSKVNEWLVFDFYKDGELTMQWYNNLYNTIAGKDNRLNFISLDSQSIYVNGKLQDGIEITPVEIKGGGGEVVRFVSNAKTTYIMMGLYAENYGEFIKVTTTVQGYLITSIQRSSAKVTFTPRGRKVEFFDSSNKPLNTLEFVQTELNTTENNGTDQMIAYFQKGDKIYEESLKNLKDQTDRHQGNDYSRFVESVARSMFNPSELNTATFVELLQNGGWKIPKLGYHSFEGGKEFGFRYRKGDQEGTYSADFYENGKISKSEKLRIKNKTPDQIAEIMKAIE